MEIQIFICAILSLSLIQAFPKKLLRVPKIYNALITTNEKLLPSEAYPATTGPVFQPLGLTGEPILLNPEAFAMNQPEGEVAPGEQPRAFMTSPENQGRNVQPITFYPRYNVYHQYNPYLPFQSYEIQEPILYSFGQNQNKGQAPTAAQPAAESPDVQPQPAAPVQQTFVKNNQPANGEIPDVLPPPPGFTQQQQQPVDDVPDAMTQDNDPRR